MNQPVASPPINHRGQPQTNRKVASVGLGAIGEAAAEEVVRRSGLDLVAAVDPARAGERIDDIEVVGSVEDLGEIEIDVALVATASSVPKLADDIAPLVSRGVDIVSSCEALIYPWLNNEVIAEGMDTLAREYESTIVATGVNPGFIMDLLPVVVNSAVLGCQGVSVKRNVDLTRRRPQLQQKLGAGLTEEEWHEKNEQGGGLGHAGLEESAVLAAVGLDWNHESVTFERAPVIIDGKAVGIREVAEVRTTQGPTVDLELVFQLNSRDVDTVTIQGPTQVEMTLEGIHGDQATVARLVHACGVVGEVSPGLRLATELPSWRA